MYVITDCEGLRTLVSYKAIGYYAKEVLGVPVSDNELLWGLGASIGIKLGMQALGYTVARVVGDNEIIL